jgi:hypothetical protein
VCVCLCTRASACVRVCVARKARVSGRSKRRLTKYSRLFSLIFFFARAGDNASSAHTCKISNSSGSSSTQARRADAVLYHPVKQYNTWLCPRRDVMSPRDDVMSPRADVISQRMDAWERPLPPGRGQINAAADFVAAAGLVVGLLRRGCMVRGCFAHAHTHTHIHR